MDICRWKFRSNHCRDGKGIIIGMKGKMFLLLASMLFFSCSKEKMKFQSEKWMPIESGLYGKNYRKKMVNDLIQNKLSFGSFKIKGTSKSEVIKLIGEPDRIDECDDSEVYILEEKYGIIDPNGYSFLKLSYEEGEFLIYWEIEKSVFRE